MDFGGRKEIFRALVGSHNYNLNTPDSDRDYKVFITPIFDDLYMGNQFSKSYIGEVEDLDVHDIRKVSSLWWKANVNFLEVLFSNEVMLMQKQKFDTYIEGSKVDAVNQLLQKIFDIKNEIARMNLPYLYDACIGMHLNKKKMIDKGTEGTQHLVDKYGYDTKQAMHSLRILDFLHRFVQTDFNDFKYAIKYKLDDVQDWYGKFLLSVKSGELTKEEYIQASEQKLRWVEDNFKHLYKEQKPDEMTSQNLLGIIKEIVSVNL